MYTKSVKLLYLTFVQRRLVPLALLFALPLLAAGQQIVVGAERLDVYLPALEQKQIGLVVNHSSLLGQTHLIDTLLARGVCISRIFAPEHGFRGDQPDGETIRDGADVRTGLPVISLYGKHKKPLPADFRNLDLIVFDIQDVGARFYTYISTLYYVEEACAENGVPLLVLDRPNPNGHYVDGPLLEYGMESFVGIAPIPIVHGCTVGELARMFAGERFIHSAENLQLTVIRCDHYTHQSPYTLPVRPSPNLPNQRSILLYPSLCLFEGTCVSVGRGTDMPFQVFGHPAYPYGDIHFTPCPNEASKYPPLENEICSGFDLSTLHPDSIFAHPGLDLHWLLDFYCEFPEKSGFFLSNHYFDLLAGTQELRKAIELGTSEESIKAGWQDGLRFYKLVRNDYLLYPE